MRLVKKLVRALIFPHIAVMLVLVPISIVFLVYSMVFMGTRSIPSIISYVLAFYSLSVWCLKIPRIISAVKKFKNENKYAKRWLEDPRTRVNVSLYGTLVWNTAYGVFQLGLGFYHSSFWFFSLSAYYISLAVMRFFLVRHTRRYSPGERMREELIKYRVCGIIFLVMNLALSLMIFFMVYWDRTFKHHEITTIAMAAYTFVTLTTAIINVVKYKKYNSPVYSAARAISLAAACVSMITLETTMLTTFSDGTMDPLARKLMLASTGVAVSAFIVTMAVYMIVHSTKKLKPYGSVKEKYNER